MGRTITTEELFGQPKTKKTLSTEELFNGGGIPTVTPEVMPKKEALLPGFHTTEQAISERPDLGKEFVRDYVMTKPPSFFEHPIKNILHTPSMALKGISALAQRAEAIPANMGLKLQMGEKASPLQAGLRSIPPLAYLKEIKQAVTGERLGQLGDIPRRAGVPEPLSAMIGLGASAGLSNLVSGGRVVSGANKVVDKTLTPVKAVSKSVSEIPTNVRNLTHPEEFAQKVRQGMFNQRKQLGQVLDENITKLSSNSNNPIDLSSHFGEMKEAMTAKDVEGNLLNPGLRNDLNAIIKKIKDPQQAKMINELINNPEGARELTLKQAETIKRAISQSPIVQRIYSQGKFAKITSGDTEILDLLDNIKNAQAEQFPQLAKLRQPYAEHMSAYNKVKNAFKEGRLLGKMRKGFGDEETMSNIRKVLPEDILKQITGFRRTGKISEWAGKTVGLGAAYELLKKSFTGEF